MERETGARQSQSEPKESPNGSQPSSSDPAPSSSTSSSGPTPSPVTPTPPRLTPNPLLLDSPAGALSTPITCSPPPPLTPAPSLSASAHVTKSATPTSPHLLVPAPPKLTSTATPTLRTYARPILPLPAKTTPQNSSSATATTASTTTATAITNSSTTSATTTSSATKTPSSSLTNGSTKTVATTTSTPITPFHTPASPPGRQVSQSLPVGSPGLARANQNAAPVRQRVSQQTLLLGKGLRGTGQDQVLLRAQMLQSLTLRPPPPGALTIPPSLRLKPPSSTSSSVAPPPPLSRPQTALFPPLRPRPVTTTTTDSTTTTTSTPSRHLSVPPPTLYSPVRAVPLRPRLLSPNGLRTPTPKPFHPIAAAAPPTTSTVSSPTSINRSVSGLKTQSLLSPGPPPTSPCFERSPSAARQLQIIALSSGRQLQNANATPQKLAVHSESKTVLPLSPTLAKRSSPLPSPTSQKDKLKQEKNEEADKAPKDFKPVIVDQREREKSKVAVEKDDVIVAKKPRLDEKISSDAMDVTEQSQSGKKQEEEKKTSNVATEDQSKKVQNRDEAKDSKTETKPRISEANTLTSPLKTVPSPTQKSSPVAVSIASPVRTQASMATTALSGGPNQSPVPSAVPVSSPIQEVTANQSHPSRFSELHPTNQDDNLSVQSDNQSALSSLSSQSPPCSPFISPTTEPSLPPPQPPDRPTDLSLNHKPNHTQNHDTPTEPEPLHQSEEEREEEGEETEGFDQSEVCPWEPRAWPEGQQVLTHLVEGFVIQEGLTPFPVNRSSLLVPDQVPKPQEVNGTNGTATLPVTTETRKQSEHSTDSEEEDGGEPDDHNSTTRPSQRDRAVLHCQFCGKRGHAHNFMRSKRFCSTSCARGFNVRLTKRLRALSAGSRPDRPRPVLNRAESVPGKPLLLRLPKDLWSAGRKEKEVKEKPPPAAAEEEEDMEVEAGAEEDDGDDAPEEEEEEEEEEDEEDEEEEEEPAAMTTSPHSNNSITHNSNNNHISHNNTVAHNNSVSHGNTQTDGVVQQRVQRRASAPAVTSTFRPAPSQWSVEEVTAFINTLPGCGDVAEAFRVQEIDGQALLLLTEDHLMTSMNIKLGPALKICAHINSLKNQ